MLTWGKLSLHWHSSAAGSVMLEYCRFIIKVLNHLTIVIKAAIVFLDSAATRLIHFFSASLCGGKTVRPKPLKLLILLNPTKNNILLHNLRHRLSLYYVAYLVAHALTVARTMPIDKCPILWGILL